MSDLKAHALKTHGASAPKDVVAMSMAACLLRNALGEPWALKNLFDSDGRGDPYLEFGAEASHQRWVYGWREINLAEMLLNLGTVPGAKERFERLKQVDLTSAVAELEAAKLLYQGGVEFRFRDESGQRGADYDVEIVPSDGPRIACEVKSKNLDAKSPEQSFVKTARKAIGQLPRDAPGMAFIQLPEAWTASRYPPTWLDASVERIFASSSRLAGLVVLAERWLQIPEGRISSMAVDVRRNWRSPHVWHAGLHVLDHLDTAGFGQNWINLQDEATGSFGAINAQSHVVDQDRNIERSSLSI